MSGAGAGPQQSYSGGDFQTPLGTTPTTGQLAVDQQRNQMLAQIYQLLKTMITGGTLTITNSAPATAASPGVAGTIAYDATHIYVCIATNTWCRATIATW